MIHALFAHLSHCLPELVVVLTMIGLLFIESTYQKGERGRNYIFISSMIGLSIALLLLILNLGAKPTAVFTNALIIDPFSTFAKIIMVLGTIGVVYLSTQSSDIYDNLKSEFSILCIGVLAGGMILASANNMLTIYLGVETLSILSYVLASLKRYDSKSNEAGLKYALYGGVTAGIMLFGISHLYGVFGSIQFDVIMKGIISLNESQLWIVIPSFILFFAGLAYKISAFPFHMWTPDVYEGSPIPVTTFFAIIPKVAAIIAILRVSSVFFGGEETVLTETWLTLIKVIAILTMTIGNVCAIGQRSVKRMLAYSSIGHAGVMLLGAVAIDEIGNKSILFYAATYLFMTLVAFFITTFVSEKYNNDHFERFSGLLKRYPIMAIMMMITMFSLAGMPPFSGFVAKFNIINAMLAKGYFVVAILAALNSVISLYYYMKIVRFMAFNPPESTEKIENFKFLNQLIVVALTIPVLFLGVFWNKIILIAANAKMFIQG